MFVFSCTQGTGHTCLAIYIPLSFSGWRLYWLVSPLACAGCSASLPAVQQRSGGDRTLSFSDANPGGYQNKYSLIRSLYFMYPL